MVLAIILLVILPSGSGVSLTGQWISHNYGCEGPDNIREVVDIVQNGNGIVATKVIGDDCVRGGHKTFEGTWNGKVGSVRFWGAPPGGTPGLQSQPSTLKVIGVDKFSVPYPGGVVMTYTRAPTHSNELWMWVLLLLLLILGVAAYAFRRRRRGVVTSA